MLRKLLEPLSVFLCAATLLSNCAFAAENASSNESVTQDSSSGGLRYDDSATNPVYSGYTPNYSHKYDSYQYELFMDIFNLYKDTHLYEFSEDQLTEAFMMKLMKENPDLMLLFMDTLLGSMDEYSSYYEAGSGLASDGSSKGYGIYFGTEESYEIRKLKLSEHGTYITAVAPDSPAEKAGLKAGDRIVSAENIPFDGVPYNAVVNAIRYLPYVADEVFDENGTSLGIPNEPEFVLDETTGKKSYILNLTVERNGELVSVKLQKGRFSATSVTYEAVDNAYAYIAVESFLKESVIDDFKAALELARKDGNGNLIIDLRDNGGGNLDYAEKMANLLIEEKGRVLYYINSREHEEPEAVLSDGNGKGFEKITVLINKNTASAAELFAMCLKFHCGATLVGTNSYGKAVGQYSYAFNNGDLFTVTSFEILTPLKTSYNKIGLLPDIEINLGLAKQKFPTEPFEIFNCENYKSLQEGTENETVLGLERRLVLMGYLDEEFADGVYDEKTTSAIKAMKLYRTNAPTELLDDSDVEYITGVVNKLKNYYYYEDSQMEVAKMTFKSNSQAKRRAKELERASAAIEADKKKYEEELMEQIKREEAELNEEQKKLEEAEKQTETSASPNNAENSNAES